jgi:riboflavin synthase
VSFPGALAPFIVFKGSIAVDGISLTVAGLGEDRLDVQVVPFTIEHTNLQRAHRRDRVNLECDIIGKYVARAAELATMGLRERHDTSNRNR